MEVLVCPRCGYEIPEARRGGADCPRCGIVFARYDPGRASMKPLARVVRAPRSRGPLPWIGMMLAVSLTLVLGWPDAPRRQESAPACRRTPPPTPSMAATTAIQATGSPGLTAADLASRPDLETWGSPDPDRPPALLTDDQLAEARAALQREEQVSLEVEVLDPDSELGRAAMQRPAAPAMSPVGSGPGEAAADDGQGDQDDLAWVGWYEGAGGLERAQGQIARMSPRPLVVYFHAGWCRYCRAFEADFLPDPLVRRFLSDVFRVHVEPERSAEDRALAERFGVTGYPSFFVLRPGEQPSQARRVHPFWDDRAIPVQQFVASCQEAAGM